MGKKVLIAEDEYITAELLRITIQESGHEVIAVAYTGEDAVIKAGELAPDIVFMDISMEYRSAGIDACKSIKEQHPEIAVYFLSAYPKETYTKELALITFDGYLDKGEFDSAIELLNE